MIDVAKMLINSDAVTHQEEAGTEDYSEADAVYDRGFIDRNDIFAGMEGMTDASLAPNGPRVIVRGGAAAPKPKLVVRTGDGRNFRVYFNSSMVIDPTIVNQLCRFLDHRTSQDTIIFVLGAKVDDEFSHLMGGIIGALTACPARTIGLAAGYCGIPETMIWTFCKEHEIARYGALTYGITDMVKTLQSFKLYFDVFLKHACKIGAITEADRTAIWNSKREIFLCYQDFTEGRAVKPSEEHGE